MSYGLVKLNCYTYPWDCKMVKTVSLTTDNNPLFLTNGCLWGQVVCMYTISQAQAYSLLNGLQPTEKILGPIFIWKYTSYFQAKV